eukprot:scaffold95828_cov69-Cyclotella_meneghiniana.AAC.1
MVAIDGAVLEHIGDGIFLHRPVTTYTEGEYPLSRGSDCNAMLPRVVWRHKTPLWLNLSR